MWGVPAGEGPVPVPGLHLLYAPLRPGPPQGRHRQDHHVELDAIEPIYLITVVTGEGVCETLIIIHTNASFGSSFVMKDMVTKCKK